MQFYLIIADRFNQIVNPNQAIALVILAVHEQAEKPLFDLVGPSLY
jgi:hypothetical protein